MKKLLIVVAIVAVVAISKADMLREAGEIWPTLTAMEKVIVLLVFILGAALFFAVGWQMHWLGAQLRRGLSWLARRR